MSDSKQIRSFIAIPLPDALKSSALAIQDRLKPKLPNVRWTKAESMHLTLHFFGELSQENLEKAGAVMVSIESLFSPFKLAVSGVGAFPSNDRARIVWLGVDSAGLTRLYAALSKALQMGGFRCETRPFKPHITLGRVRNSPLKARHILSPESDTVAGEMTVSGLTLFESELLPDGAVHRPRQTIQFTAG